MRFCCCVFINVYVRVKGVAFLTVYITPGKTSFFVADFFYTWLFIWFLVNPLNFFDQLLRCQHSESAAWIWCVSTSHPKDFCNFLRSPVELYTYVKDFLSPECADFVRKLGRIVTAISLKVSLIILKLGWLFINS